MKIQITNKLISKFYISRFENNVQALHDDVNIKTIKINDDIFKDNGNYDIVITNPSGIPFIIEFNYMTYSIRLKVINYICLPMCEIPLNITIPVYNNLYKELKSDSNYIHPHYSLIEGKKYYMVSKNIKLVTIKEVLYEIKENNLSFGELLELYKRNKLNTLLKYTIIYNDGKEDKSITIDDYSIFFTYGFRNYFDERKYNLLECFNEKYNEDIKKFNGYNKIKNNLYFTTEDINNTTDKENKLWKIRQNTFYTKKHLVTRASLNPCEYSIKDLKEFI